MWAMTYDLFIARARSNALQSAVSVTWQSNDTSGELRNIIVFIVLR